MAFVRSFDKTELQRNEVHGEVDCTYGSFRGADQRTYLQIDTYGSRTRKIPGKKSQTIQVDDHSAKQLLDILRETFGFK